MIICRLEDLGFRLVCEQVSHHPPISALHADGPGFRFYGSIYPKLKFWGRSIDCQPKGILTLELTKYCGNFSLLTSILVLFRRNEIYTWMPINCAVNNLVMGKMYIDLVSRCCCLSKECVVLTVMICSTARSR